MRILPFAQKRHHCVKPTDFIGRAKCSVTRQHLKTRCRDTNPIKEQVSMEWNR